MSEEQKDFYRKKFIGEGNPFYGKKHTDGTKKKLREGHCDYKGNNNPFRKALLRDPNKRVELSVRSKKIWENIKKDKERYEKYRKLRSDITIKQILEGKVPGVKGYKKGYFQSVKQGDNIYYRSSYELSFLQFCEQNQMIVFFEPAKMKIEYLDINDKKRWYLPDFIINKKVLVEIKPENMLNYHNNPRKFEAAINYCKNNNLVFMLITERELNNSKSMLDRLGLHLIEMFDSKQ